MDKIVISYIVLMELAKKHRHGSGKMIYVNWTDFKKEAEENLQRKSWWVDKINCLDSIIERAEAKLNVSNRYVHSKKEIGALLNVNPLTLNRWKEGGIINIKRVEREKLPKRLQKELSKSWYYDVFDILLQLKKYQKRKTKSVR